MQSIASTAYARSIMEEFADQTGLSGNTEEQRRYLWTDAFAVCNFLSLYRRLDDKECLLLALKLIEQVHYVLGRHRSDDDRHGWISGLGDREGDEHPTAGGLRIGKAVKERLQTEPFDERREWDRDGQYFHYLTKWMHALFMAGKVAQENTYCRWAIELARVAYAGFSKPLRPDGKNRLAWKMSIDLSYPLVPSSGLHDPLDGYVTFKELELCRKGADEESMGVDLVREIAGMSVMNQDQDWTTADPLGIGGLLFDAYRLLNFARVGNRDDEILAGVLLREVRRSLPLFLRENTLTGSAQHRLAFRELGLSIGLRAVERMQRIAAAAPGLCDSGFKHDIEVLSGYDVLQERIESFWRDQRNQQSISWKEHSDINRVMLATSLLPSEYLNIADQAGLD